MGKRLFNATMILKIGTRGSKLALTQSRWVKEKVEEKHPDVRVELENQDHR